MREEPINRSGVPSCPENGGNNETTNSDIKIEYYAGTFIKRIDKYQSAHAEEN